MNKKSVFIIIFAAIAATQAHARGGHASSSHGHASSSHSSSHAAAHTAKPRTVKTTPAPAFVFAPPRAAAPSRKCDPKVDKGCK